MSDQPAKGSRPPLAYKNEEFLNGRDSRPLRIISEYLEPLSHFRRQRDSGHGGVFRGRRAFQEDGPLGQYYKDARTLAAMVTTWAKTFRERTYRFVVCFRRRPGHHGGGEPRGDGRARQDHRGFNIGLPFEQFPNPYITHELNFEFHYFFHAKVLVRVSVEGAGGFSRRFRDDG